MKKVRLFLLATILIVFGFLLGAFSTNTYAEQTYPLKIWEKYNHGKIETFCLVDENTGVNYIVVNGKLNSKPVGVAITPRLNEDGSLYTTK